MKDEIKEILEEINKIIDNTSYNEEFTYFQTSHISKLVDCITNLQQIEQDHQKLNGELREENKKLQEENEKAMKLLKEFYDSVNYDEIIALLEKYEQFKGLKEGTNER